MYSYKAWWFDPSKQLKVLTSYSSKFKTYEKAIQWYENNGIALEKMFDRKLVLTNTDTDLDS